VSQSLPAQFEIDQKVALWSTLQIIQFDRSDVTPEAAVEQISRHGGRGL
jgi:hypothetical protein